MYMDKAKEKRHPNGTDLAELTKGLTDHIEKMICQKPEFQHLILGSETYVRFAILQAEIEGLEAVDIHNRIVSRIT